MDNLNNFFLIIQWILLIILIILIIFLVYSQIIIRIIRKYYKFPIPGFFTKIIDNPIRRKFIQKPQLIAERMDLSPGMIVVEIGPGKGSYTKIVAEKILPAGKVYAIDIQESVIKNLKKKVEKEGISNIIPRIDDAYNFSFDTESIDRIFTIACLPEIPEPIRALQECRRILKKDGLLSICELALDPDYVWRKTEKKWAKEAGLEFHKGFGNWFTYQLNFKKN